MQQGGGKAEQGGARTMEVVITPMNRLITTSPDTQMNSTKKIATGMPWPVVAIGLSLSQAWFSLSQ